MTTNLANDKNGTPFAIGDDATFTGTVVSIQDGHAMLRASSHELGNREFWFHGAILERVAKPQAAAPVVEAPAATQETAVAEKTPKEQALEYVKSQGYSEEAAAKIVEEHGTRNILDTRDEEAARKAEEEAKKQAPAAVTSPGANTQPA